MKTQVGVLLDADTIDALDRWALKHREDGAPTRSGAARAILQRFFSVTEDEEFEVSYPNGVLSWTPRKSE